MRRRRRRPPFRGARPPCPAGRGLVLLVLTLLLPLPATAGTVTPPPAGDAGAAASGANAPDRWMVTLEPAGSSGERAEAAQRVADATRALGGRVEERFPFIDAVLVALPAGHGSPPALLRGLPGVAAVHREEPVSLLLSSSRPAVGVDAALWGLGPRGARSVVAVVDSGIDPDHPDLRGRVVEQVRVDRGGARPGEGDADGHGTHIAGIAAGDGAASAGSNAGMAPEARLLAVDISGEFTTTNAVRAFEWLHQHAVERGVRVVSNSWGREKEDARYDPDDPVIRASDALVAQGLVVVFSAGNLGAGQGQGTLTVEAQNPNVLTVGAASDQGTVEPYSSRGPARHSDGREAAWTKPDLLAPGTRITSARAGAGQGGEAYVMLNGTSMAAPHVAGVVALMLDANPALTPEDVAALLTRTAHDVGPSGTDLASGAGFLDGRAAVESAIALAGGQLEPERAPFRDSGTVRPVAQRASESAAPPEPLSPLGGPVDALVQHAVPEEERVARIPLQVPEGAVGLELTFRWDDPATTFEVTLERDDGSVVLGPFRGARRDGAGMAIEVALRQPLPEGAWTLVARPEGTGTETAYEAEGALLVLHRMDVDDLLPPGARRAGSGTLGGPLGALGGAVGPGAWWMALPALAPAAALVWVWRSTGPVRRRGA